MRGYPNTGIATDELCEVMAEMPDRRARALDTFGLREGPRALKCKSEGHGAGRHRAIGCDDPASRSPVAPSGRSAARRRIPSRGCPSGAKRVR